MKEKNYCLFGVKIVLNDGTILRENLYDNLLSNLLGRWRGLLDTNYIFKETEKVYPLVNNGKFEFFNIENSEGEKIEIPLTRVSYIKYFRNTSAYGGERKKNELFPEELFN